MITRDIEENEVVPQPTDGDRIVEVFDLDKAVDELKDNPETLKAVLKDYLEQAKFAPMAIILVRMESIEPVRGVPYVKHTWHVIEGICNLQSKTFKIVQKVTEFPANARDPMRPPTAVLNFVASASLARGLSVWLI